jgi:hypothetical protein
MKYVFLTLFLGSFLAGAVKVDSLHLRMLFTSHLDERTVTWTSPFCGGYTARVDHSEWNHRVVIYLEPPSRDVVICSASGMRMRSVLIETVVEQPTVVWLRVGSLSRKIGRIR